MGLRRSDLRGVSWEDYHYMSRGYMRRLARQEVWHRNIAAAMAGKSVYDTWKIPEFDSHKVDRLPDLPTEEEKERARKILRKIQKANK